METYLPDLIKQVQSIDISIQRMIYTKLMDHKVPHFDGEHGILFILDNITKDLFEDISALVDDEEFEEV